jgi:hypothetical protein
VKKQSCPSGVFGFPQILSIFQPEIWELLGIF